MENKKDRIMYAITHIDDRDGIRRLTFANQGRNHYETEEQADKALVLYAPDLRAHLLSQAEAESLAVRPIVCYWHGDAKAPFWLNDAPHTHTQQD